MLWDVVCLDVLSWREQRMPMRTLSFLCAIMGLGTHKQGIDISAKIDCANTNVQW